ncbi:uncharacterized protein LOC127801691 [Diospyros lotus]|uniref:uncharacterized protein LOC127801691 n=1 Tax=Diospyros lotus TaxID=55363 RepID=UPI002250A96B|nr:uncharacterized protein LOC127801691 [Diospyros lotus]
MEEEELHTANATNSTEDRKTSTDVENNALFYESNMYSSEIDSACSTPYVSAPSSPGRGLAGAGAGAGGGGGGGFFYSAPASPMHFLLSSSYSHSPPVSTEASVPAGNYSVEFEFSARFGTVESTSTGVMSSADELFLNGQIRPMKLSTHLQRPQVLAPLLDLDDETELGDSVTTLTEKFPRGRDVKWRDRSQRRRTRSMSPLRVSSFDWNESTDEEDEKAEKIHHALGVEAVESKQSDVASRETTPSISASSSRSSSASRSSKRWVFLKEFLYRSKSEGSNNAHKFWSHISFSPVKDRKVATPPVTEPKGKIECKTGSNAEEKKVKKSGKQPSKKASNGVGAKRRVVVPPSAHELHYKANRAHAEEMRKRTFLPYRQGLLGCLGFSSKSYSAMNGFARALNPVSSR